MIIERALSSRILPNYLRYLTLRNKNRRLGIRSNYLTISFDCDRDIDAKAAVKLADWLAARKIKATFAVPGETLLENIRDYLHVKKLGFEFMNHGYAKHMVRLRKGFVGSSWYHEMSASEISNDIVVADRVLRSKLKVKPRGYRAPHFGLFQREAQLNLIYKCLKKLKYHYASTTTPEKALLNGSVYDVGELYEVPVSHAFDFPATILDSWTFLESPQRIYSKSDYVKQFRKTIDYFSSKQSSGYIFNIYVDPSHVVNFPSFYKCVEYALRKGFNSVDYSGLLNLL